MNVTDQISSMMAKGLSCKDFITFLSIHARGNVLHLGMCESGCGVTALLYGVENNGGHVWTVNPFCPECLQVEPFAGHPQWTLIESDPLDVAYIRSGGVPEEVDLIYINPDKDKLNTTLILKSWGTTIKTTGKIIVSGVKGDWGVKEACEDFAKSYGMKFHPRQSEADLGVIFYPDNKEALKNE